MYAESSLLRFIKSMKAGKAWKAGRGAMRGGSLGGILKDKATFLSMVFGTLIFQLLLVALTIRSIPTDSVLTRAIRSFTMVIFILQLGLILLMAFVPMSTTIKFFLFSIFSVLTGIMINAIVKATDKNIVHAAIAGTVVFFVMFGILGVACAALGIELNMLGLFLFFALFALIIANVVYLFMKETAMMTRILATLALVIFGGYVAYDTNMILQRDYMGDFVTAALDYFLDIINIFLNILRLMTSGRLD